MANVTGMPSNSETENGLPKTARLSSSGVRCRAALASPQSQCEDGDSVRCSCDETNRCVVRVLRDLLSDALFIRRDDHLAESL